MKQLRGLYAQTFFTFRKTLVQKGIILLLLRFVVILGQSLQDKVRGTY